jgi:hypothetical protein
MNFRLERILLISTLLVLTSCGADADPPRAISIGEPTNDAGMTSDDVGRSRDAAADSGLPDWFFQPVECADADLQQPIEYPPGPAFDPVQTDLGISNRLVKSRETPAGTTSNRLSLQVAGAVNSRSGGRGWVINQPGDIGFSIAVTTTKSLAADTTLTFTTLMDYRAVDTNWELVGEADDEIESRQTGSGFHVPFDEPVEVVHGTIPYEAFSEPGYHELTVSFAAGGPSQHIATNIKRLSIWNQSGSRLAHPCFVPEKSTPNSETEIVMRSFLNGRTAVSYIDGETDQGHLQNGFLARPGERITANYFLVGQPFFEKARYPAAVIPALNGAPLRAASFIITPLTVEDASIRPVYRETMYRNEITFTAPEEPGAYDFHAVVVTNPFRPRTTPDGLYHYWEKPDPSTYSTKLRIIVER